MVFGSDTTKMAIMEREALYRLLSIKPTKSTVWAVLTKDNSRGFDAEGGRIEIVESLPLDKFPVQSNIEKLQRYYESKYSQPVKLTISTGKDTDDQIIEPTVDQLGEVKFTTTSMVDREGNEIYKDGNAFFLKLEGETRKRKLGTMNSRVNRLQIHKIRKKHLMEKIQGYGFNYLFLKNAKSFHTIELYDEVSQWVIPKEFILENGQFLHFKKEGFELQIFMSLEKLDTFLTKAGV